MGVWIETNNQHCKNKNAKSHPVWVCGLKHSITIERPKRSIVTPCMGVWIETTSYH